ncbi:MAG: RodZ domain-containing protein [Litorimonas sp.]
MKAEMAPIDTTDSNTLPLGARLRAQRLALGWSLDEASSRCGVGRDFLAALERNELTRLPTIGYGLGYVRAYARVLGLNTEQSVADFKRDSAAVFDLNRRDQPHFVPKRRVRLPRGTVPALSVVAAVVMLGTWYGVQLETVATPGPAAVAFDPDHIETAAPTPDNILTVRTTSPSWISIRNARGRLTVNRVFVTGETWQAEVGQSYTIDVRDAGAVELYVGETSRGTLGAQGVPMKDVDLSIIR